MKTGYKVCDAMTRKAIVVDEVDTVSLCSEEMEKHQVGAVLVRNDEKLVGVITEQDIVRKVVAKGKSPVDVAAKDIMSTNIVNISPEEDVFDALSKMRNLNIRHLPVITDGKMIGLLALKDILRIQPQMFDILVEKCELTAEDRKPINNLSDAEGICQTCGEYSPELKHKEGTLVCSKCDEP